VYDDFDDASGRIEADIQRMEDFARLLASHVDADYRPGLDQIISSMTTRLPDVSAEFAELKAFNDRHHRVQLTTFVNTFNFRDGTHRMAGAAQWISNEYRDTDAFTHARLADVGRAFDQAAHTAIPADDPEERL
jgi:hypothetical protein